MRVLVGILVGYVLAKTEQYWAPALKEAFSAIMSRVRKQPKV